MTDVVNKITINIWQEGENFRVKVNDDLPTNFNFPEPYWSEFKRSLKVRPEISHLFGHRIFEMVFSTPERLKIFEKFTSSDHLLVRVVSSNPEVHSIPWELLNPRPQSNAFLFISGKASIVRVDPSAPSAYTPPLELPIKMLVIVSLPLEVYEEHPIDPLKEIEILRRALEKYTASGVLKIDIELEANEAKIKERFARGNYHIVHYIGHGAKGRKLLIEDARDYHRAHLVDGFEFAEIFGNLKTGMVVLNACETGASDFQAFSSSAFYLHKKGIPIVIAHQTTVSDLDAIETTKKLYESIFEPTHPFSALDNARLYISSRGGEWWNPVLYLGKEEHVFKDISNRIPTEREKKVFTGLGLYSSGKPFVYRFVPIRKVIHHLQEAHIVVLHGIGGSGKSYIADYIAHILKTSFNHVIAVKLPDEEIKTPYDLLEFLMTECLEAGTLNYEDFLPLKEKVESMKNKLPDIAPVTVFNEFLKKLKYPSILLILDDFEFLLKSDGSLTSPAWKNLLKKINSGDIPLKVIITTRLSLYFTSREPLRPVVEIETFTDREFTYFLNQIEDEKVVNGLKIRSLELIKYDFHPLYTGILANDPSLEPEEVFKDPEMDRVMEFYSHYFLKDKGLSNLFLIEPTSGFQTVISKKLLNTLLPQFPELRSLLVDRLKILSGHKSGYRIYGIILDAVRKRLKIDIPESLKDKLLEFTPERTGDALVVIRILEKLDGDDVKLKLFELYNALGSDFRESGNLTMADAMVRHAKEIANSIKNKLPEEKLAIYYNNLAMILKAKGEYDGAEENFKKAHEIFEEARKRRGGAGIYFLESTRIYIKYLEVALKNGKEIRDEIKYLADLVWQLHLLTLSGQFTPPQMIRILVQFADLVILYGTEKGVEVDESLISGSNAWRNLLGFEPFRIILKMGGSRAFAEILKEVSLSMYGTGEIIKQFMSSPEIARGDDTQN